MALKDAPVVEILSFDEQEAYDPERCISSLIRTQLLHLHQAEYIVVPPEFQTNVNINSIHTEREASEHIGRLTQLLHRFGKTSGGKTTVKRRSSAKKKTAKRAKKKSAGKKKRTKSAKKTHAKKNTRSAKHRSSR